MKNENILRLIIINLVIFSLFVVAVDFCCAFYKYQKNLYSFRQTLKKRGDYTQEEYNSPPMAFEYSLKLNHFKKVWINSKHELSTQKRLVTAEKNKKSVIVFGCSFAEGTHLNSDESFIYQLSKKLNRTVYNRGFAGFGLSEALWLTKQDELYKDIDTEPEYIIYIYIADHLTRIYKGKYGVDTNTYISFSKNKERQLVKRNPFDLQLARLYMYKNYKEQSIQRKFSSAKYNDEYFDMIKLYFEQMRNEIRKRYPDIKFIIIKHPSFMEFDDSGYDGIHAYTYCYVTPRWQELEDSGFIVYDLRKELDEDITSKEYTVFDEHPNAKAWKLVIDKLVKKSIIN